MKRNFTLIVTVTIFTAAFLLVGISPALADEAGTVHLICRPSGDAANAMIQDSPTTIDLNESQASATIHFAAFRLKGSISGPVPARTVGPMHAAFSDEAVTFENPDPNSAPNGGPDEYVLNRLTGDLSGKWGEDQMNCEAASKRF
jgi:hypothetical protein